MKRRHMDFETFKKRALKNPRIRAQYNRLEPEFAVINAVLKARIEKGLTQKQLAEKVGTKQSAIARLESGQSNPSIGFLQKITRALNSNLQIEFR